MAKRKSYNHVEKRRSGRLASAEVAVDYRETDTEGSDGNPGRRMRKRAKVDYAEKIPEDTRNNRAAQGESLDDEWQHDDTASTVSDDLETASTEVNCGMAQGSSSQGTRRRGTSRKSTRSSAASFRTNAKTLMSDKEIDPEVIAAARTFEKRKHDYLKPLHLSRNRLTIDSWNVVLYAEEGAKDVWASAFSSSRFNGPRRHPPWRELHRLTDPAKEDFSDWAENVRWAKEQHRLYGSVWTEYYYSLETIKEHRIKSYWASEELINSDKFSGDAPRGGRRI